MNIKEKITAEISKLNEEQLYYLEQVIKTINTEPGKVKKTLPRCAGISESNITNLSERDEELLWQKNQF
jgi:hypothetical protein